MSEINWRTLAEPFPRSEVKTLTKGNAKISFITARHVMNRLDEVVGPANWRDEYTEVGDGGVVCTLYLRVDGEWVGKSDVGIKEGNVEPIKGKYSVAFKRAAVRWGIGRELYKDGTAFDDEDDAQDAPQPRYEARSGALAQKAVSEAPKPKPDQSRRIDWKTVPAIRQLEAWATSVVWQGKVERPHAVNRIARALDLEGTPNGSFDLLAEMILEQVGYSEEEARRRIQTYEPESDTKAGRVEQPAQPAPLPEPAAPSLGGICVDCGQDTTRQASDGTFRCKPCADKKMAEYEAQKAAPKSAEKKRSSRAAVMAQAPA